AAYVGARFGHPYAMRPAVWSVSGSSGRIAGYLTRPDDLSAWFAYFYLDLEKVEGQWRIAGETPVRAQPAEPPLDAAGLIAMLDAAGIKRAVVLSDAYYFDEPGVPGADDAYAAVRAENDWTAAQAARFPDRLVAFCSVNPLRE